MEINIRLNLGLPKWVARGLVLAGIPAVLALGMSALARADTVTVPHFNPGDKLKAQDLNDRFDALAAAINNPDPECPRGYAKDSGTTTFVLCTKGADEVVKVGSGATAFWADRYEASVWGDPQGTTGPLAGVPYGTFSKGDDFPNSFPDTGQWTSKLYAVSKTGVMPSASLTWFQANEACRASGKRLPTGSEWLAAGKGTPDGAGCQTATTNTSPRNAGLGSGCRSTWGAEDMIGNLIEWTDEWYAGPMTSATGVNAAPWPTSGVSGSYQGDYTWGITSYAYTGSSYVAGAPAAALRGGAWNYGAAAGLFALFLGSAPSYWSPYFGLRCVFPSR
jgi:hypothetical protein